MLLNSFYRLLGVVWGVKGRGGGQFETGNMSEIAKNTKAGEVGNLRTLLRSAIFFNLSFRLRKCLLIGGTFYVEFVIVLFSINSQ
jgi:hypothetical protein